MTTTVRAAIMLAVLVGLPSAWMYYGPLPPQAQCVADRFVASAKEAINWEKLTAPPEAMIPPAAAAGGAPIAPQITPAVAPAPSLAQQVEPLLVRLRQWGAAEYQLEPWGADARLFRFSCEMPLAGGSPAMQQFEAVAAQPQASIAQVVADVGSWRTTQLTVMR
jgi:hypothetical protein